MNSLITQEMLLQYPMIAIAKTIGSLYNCEFKLFYSDFKTDKNEKVLEGYHVLFPNKAVLSIMFSPFMYCDNRTNPYIFKNNRYYPASPIHNLETNTAEIAIIVNGKLVELDNNDTVAGWQTIEDILEWARKVNEY